MSSTPEEKCRMQETVDASIPREICVHVCSYLWYATSSWSIFTLLSHPSEPLFLPAEPGVQSLAASAALLQGAARRDGDDKGTVAVARAET